MLAAIALLVPAIAGRSKALAAAVMVGVAARFAVTGIAEISGNHAWLVAAGWTGLALGALSFYAALAFELEGTEGHAVLPVLRSGAAADAVRHGKGEREPEPGVRSQL